MGADKTTDAGKGNARRFALSAVLLVACAVLRWACASAGAGFWPAYRGFSKRLTSLLCFVTSPVPFAVWDAAVAVLAVLFVVFLLRAIRRRSGVLLVLSRAVLLASLAAFLFVVWALNHYAPPLAEQIGLEVGEYSVDELFEASSYYLGRAAELAPKVLRDADGNLSGQDFYELAGIAGSAYEAVCEKSGDQSDVWRGPTTPVKALLVAGEPLLYSGHTGVFFAPTGEACVPLNCARTDLPFILCHEAGHRLALAREQEANFAAFVACAASDDARFAYAGYYNAFVYCYNALARADADAAQALLQEALASKNAAGVTLVLNDWSATRAHYDAYEGPFEKVGTTVNDTYLKSFGEQAGVRSYGLVVDYLIAWRNAPLFN